MRQKERFMPTIIPIKELKNTAEISKLCDEKNEPIFVTKNGYGDMVVMSQDCFDDKYGDDFVSLIKRLYSKREDYLNIKLYENLTENAKSEDEKTFYTGVFNTVLKIKQKEVIRNERY